MLHAMGFDHPTFANAAWLVPGARGLLLPVSEIR